MNFQIVFSNSLNLGQLTSDNKKDMKTTDHLDLIYPQNFQLVVYCSTPISLSECAIYRFWLLSVLFKLVMEFNSWGGKLHQLESWWEQIAIILLEILESNNHGECFTLHIRIIFLFGAGGMLQWKLKLIANSVKLRIGFQS